ncbi:MULTISPECIES: type II toxin-antitoxin system RelB/DinJ family antitoxin [Mannheimia]|uniref:Type II toxin-antitoxin system RelB/DinJ family antitoxin n=2 Tax=Mannheimia TaxID=75984 RepID=A0A7H8UM52_9PAST|nr:MULTISPECIES: type II toxin-antitoxin system RelB/DinJ family antitoxin [Mannheimia]QHB16706.1 type II toxin-antitoxin system RelB/DinJ family antitoxin [Mannheimia pernigra]QLB39531.1 type II toxin-antitoxin system RelB/DinJ family antitoxin [Mannheimia pernigra]QLB41493.1 type II toxin-antitoxin system RelB/DinJ family antitoxin [Mannheimia pernigra]QLB43410.1 type II toxin-antitoxin system RelB/DinJ family antitoxin [Mannheimia pernigra]QTM01267.1 type II toxin-antitoxin system RelB/DinJ
MANSALVSVRISPEIKEQASEVLAGIGLTVSDVMRMTLAKIATEKRFQFDYQPNVETAEVLKAVRNGDEKLNPAKNIADLMEQLNARD